VAREEAGDACVAASMLARRNSSDGSINLIVSYLVDEVETGVSSTDIARQRGLDLLQACHSRALAWRALYEVAAADLYACDAIAAGMEVQRMRRLVEAGA
jgi:hypothetical protein